MNSPRDLRVRRKGAVAVFVVISLVVLIGFAALAIDVGYLYSVKAHLQKSADASALAGAAVMFDINGLNEYKIYDTAQHYVDINESVPPDADIEIGEWLEGNFYQGYTPETANAVRVFVDRKEKLFFAPVLGFSESTVGAEAIASREWLSATCSVPIGLRTPAFGPVDFDVSAANPGKDGPSSPYNGQYFKIGEKVLVFAFGKGPRPPVHLVLDLPQFNGVAETNKILSGKYEKDCGNIALGDEFEVWNNGAGDGSFGEKLEDRMEDDNPANDTIVIPVLDTTFDSHDGAGKLTGHVKVVDFVGVHLDEIIETEVIDPKDDGKTLTVKLLMGTVKAVTTSGTANQNMPPGYSYTVSSLRLVK